MVRFAGTKWSARSREWGMPMPIAGTVGQGDAMAMILDFRTRGERAESRERAEPTSAEIIIFPGVRRERNPEPPKPTRRKRAPKRDRLELPD
jgi:hypothetical protein